MRNVLIPVFDGLQSLDVTGPLEVFAHAGGYHVTTASLGGRPVRTTSGLRITPDADLTQLSTAATHLLLVPGGAGARRRFPELVQWLRGKALSATTVASVWTGAFLLAEAGLLNGRRAATHWWYRAELAEQYPDVTVGPDPVFIRDGDIATSAGVTAGIDLALALVEDDLSRDRALGVARRLVSPTEYRRRFRPKEII